ncbi:ABC transporter substrate-binding protein [Halosolutus gelatinilyticus]|uniref:ABC transporter substrate-binding protein n=1 Tax=Halosolutus gelatinilyticus TaxID=2931975 RepID=UPI001FF10AA5|nr:ABC transporter substrate-binding protein [Halosolutus gelatinilyticus]
MSFRPNRRELLTAAGVGGCSALAGCLGTLSDLDVRDVDDGDVGGTDRTLKLGVMQPITGNLGSVGAPIRDAAILPVEQVQGEIDLEIDYEVADTATSPAAGVKGAAALVKAGYPMVNGPSASDVTLQATQQVLIPHRVVSCSPASTSPTITALNDAGLVFRTALSDSLQAVILAEQAATDLGHDTAATMYVNNDYGWQLSQAFSQSFRTAHAGTVSAQVPLDEESDSYAAEIDEALADDPGLVVVIGYPDTGTQLFSDMGTKMDEVDILVTDGLRDGGLHEEVEYPIDGIRGTAPLVGGPGEQFFSEHYRKTYGNDPGIFTAHAYDSTAVLLLANAYAGQNDGTAIRNAMQAVTNGPGEVVEPKTLADGIERAAQGENVEYRGASSPLSFDENGDVTDATFEYWEFDQNADGGITEIDRVST